MFEIQEALDEARAGGVGVDERTRKTLAAQRERLLARHQDEGLRLTGPLAIAWDAAGPEERPALLEQFKRGLATRAYLKTVIEDLANALGQNDGGS